MGTTLDSMQDQLLAKLAEIFPSPQYQVEDWPDDPRNYKFAHNNAAILLVFNDRKFENPQASDGTIQTNFPGFQIAFFTRSLRAKNDRDGAYGLLEKCRNELSGFPLSQGNMYIEREFFRAQKPGGVWIFGQNWKTIDVFD